MNGINLDDYFPFQRSFNSVVFIHKKFRKKSTNNIKNSINTDCKSKEKIFCKNCANCKNYNDKIYNEKEPIIKHNNDDIVVDQTIKFAKDIVPLVIPPSREDNVLPPVFYTVKVSKHSKNKLKKKPNDCSYEQYPDGTYDKDKIKPRPREVQVDKNSKYKRENVNIQMSGNVSVNNTIEDLNMNQSLSSVELSNKKYCKRKKSYDNQKIIASESFEALANDIMYDASSNTKIKICLMNEKDKNIISENIRIPIIRAIKDSIIELNSYSAINSEIHTVQKVVKCNTEKLDNITAKLSCIETKLDKYSKLLDGPVSSSPRVQMKSANVNSVMEDLEDDQVEYKNTRMNNMKEKIFSYKNIDERQCVREIKLNVVHENPNMNVRFCDPKGRGEDVSDLNDSLNTEGIKPDRPNRLPARFCWTESSTK